MWFIYIARLESEKLYVGKTRDLGRRVVEHLTGRGGRTSQTFGFGALLYIELHFNASSAARRELQLKRWSAEKKRALIAADFQRLKQLSVPHKSRKPAKRS